ncbi:hypothetical protein EV198_3684 [Roseivirga ehrenbergii]|uniref:Uncharacterized protein n=1 Tax=Roseivirga ehrenbergii (strain DSM 102268 / JCM 13514 / KCTC 12282 / NCIMB 14502 / KMM 6017) TaxID=279360 RepID=A0A150XNG6_ROSEK|nr:hypothetical protein MB14_16405 [Roseivirga ehrenbergii]TCK99151.1 hypothetical protein EV198_3684 [Roseivirga ehrenbergii]
MKVLGYFFMLLGILAGVLVFFVSGVIEIELFEGLWNLPIKAFTLILSVILLFFGIRILRRNNRRLEV